MASSELVSPALGFRSRSERLWRWLLEPKDVAALVAFRIALGLLISVSTARFLLYGWVDTLFVAPKFRFTYWAFDWLPALPDSWVHGAFVVVTVLGLLMAAGLFYRVVTPLLFVVFSAIQLIDVTNYLNHYYLVCLLLALHVFIPSHRAFSLDVLRKPELRTRTLPAWCTYLLRFQIGCVYFFAGLAKFTGDWLLHAQPLNIWLAARTSLPVVGPWVEERWVAYFAAWAGFLFDTTIVAFLLMRRTRIFAYFVVLGFHAGTSMLFPIGMFPVIMVLGALVFFDPSWPRRLVKLLGRPLEEDAPASSAATRPSRLAWAALGVAALYCAIQLALPLRTHLYGGNVLWHEQGMRFSWRVMAREKNGSVTFIVRQVGSEKEWHVSPRRYLTRLQEREMSVQPDLMIQLAHHIARDFQARGLGPVEVHADAKVSLNGRPAEVFVDPSVDLAKLSDGVAPKLWIRPTPSTEPIRLKPTYARIP